jgi:hypothetical protein
MTVPCCGLRLFASCCGCRRRVGCCRLVQGGVAVSGGQFVMVFAVLVTSLSVFVEFVGSVVLLVAVVCVLFVVGSGLVTPPCAVVFGVVVASLR